MNSLRLFGGSPVYSNRVAAASEIVYRWRFFIGGSRGFMSAGTFHCYRLPSRLLHSCARLFKKDLNLDLNVEDNELS